MAKRKRERRPPPNTVLRTANGMEGLDLDEVFRWIMNEVLFERAMSDRDLAKQLGVSQQNVSRFAIRGGTTLNFVSRFCAFLGETLPETYARYPHAQTKAAPPQPSALLRETLELQDALLRFIDSARSTHRRRAQAPPPPQKPIE